MDRIELVEPTAAVHVGPDKAAGRSRLSFCRKRCAYSGLHMRSQAARVTFLRERTRHVAVDGHALQLAVAVATLWVLSVGGMAEDTLLESTLLPLTDADGSPARQRRATRLRLVSIFRQGWITILVALLNQQRLPRGRFVPEPWPQSRTDNSQREIPELRLAA